MATYEYLTQAGLSHYNDKIKETYPTKTAVTNEITSAIAGVTQFDYQIVNSLPVSGTKGIIYLVANSGSGQNIYDEYIWIETTEGTTTTGRYELFGTKELTVVEYVGDGSFVEIVDGTGANAGKKVVQLKNTKVVTRVDVLGDTDNGVSLGYKQNGDDAQTYAEIIGFPKASTSTSDVYVAKDAFDMSDKVDFKIKDAIKNGAAAGATALQSVASSGSTVTITGEGTAKNLEVASTIVSGAAAGATATQPGDFGAISNASIDALFS